MSSKLILCAVITVATFAEPAWASITVAGSAISGSGPYLWNYSIAGDSSEELVAGNYATCMGGVACGTFFTIYDFKGYVTASAVAPTNWTVSVMLTGLTPAGQAVTDDSGVVNLVFQYTGVTITSPGSATSGFEAESIYGTAALGGTFSYEAQKIMNSSAPDQGQGPLTVPGPVTTAEPATMSLFAGGFALFGLARLRAKV